MIILVSDVCNGLYWLKNNVYSMWCHFLQRCTRFKSYRYVQSKSTLQRYVSHIHEGCELGQLLTRAKYPKLQYVLFTMLRWCDIVLQMNAYLEPTLIQQVMCVHLVHWDTIRTLVDRRTVNIAVLGSLLSPLVPSLSQIVQVCGEAICGFNGVYKCTINTWYHYY